MDLYELGTLDANFLRNGLHNALLKCPLVANREQWIVARINEKLSSPATRLQGLTVLEAFLPQCSDDVFSGHAVSWMQQCLYALEAQVRSDRAPLAFHVLKILLQMSSNFSELTKQISSSVVSKALEKIVANMDGDMKPALQCLHSLMTHYGGACGTNKSLLEQALLRSVGSPRRAAQAARCWALLASVGGGGGQRANHKQQWVAMQLRLCNTLHHLLARLLHQYRILHCWVETDDTLPLPDVNEEDPVASIQKLTKQLCSVSKFLQAMLRGVFPVVKSVSVGEVMEVVCRGLAVNCFSKPQKDANKEVVVVTCMPDIHLAMLGILEALIACCGRNLIPFGGMICDLTLQELKWTATDSSQYASERPFGSVRVATCRVLASWLNISKAASLVEKHAVELVAALLVDIQSTKHGITLSVSQSKVKDSPKNAHKSDTPSSIPLMRSKLQNGHANSEVCAAALEALHCIVSSGGTFMPLKVHKVLQEKVVALLMDVQRSSGPEEVPIPYIVPKCRLGLYHLLEALAMCPHGEWAPPTNFALAAFSWGQADQNRQVSSFCTTALCHMEKVAHPACTSLQFPTAARSEGLDVMHGEMRTSWLGMESSRDVGLVSFADNKTSSKTANDGEHDDITEASGLEEIVVEAVSQESDSDDDDDGLPITFETSEENLHSNFNVCSRASSAPERMDLADSTNNRFWTDSVSKGASIVMDESGNSSGVGMISEVKKPKERNWKEKVTRTDGLSPKKAAYREESSLIETVSLGSVKEHEEDSDHCWTAEEAALVSDIVKDFELGDDSSMEDHEGTVGSSEGEEMVEEAVASNGISEMKKRSTGVSQAKGSKTSSRQTMCSKKTRKREASPLPTSTGPKDKRIKTGSFLQMLQDEKILGEKEVEKLNTDDVKEDIEQVASDEIEKQHDADEDENIEKIKSEEQKMSIAEEYQEKTLSEQQNIVSEQVQKESSLIHDKEQEMSVSQMKKISGNTEQVKLQESKQAERESMSVQNSSTQLETSDKISEQVQVQEDGKTGEQNDLKQQGFTQLEMDDANNKNIKQDDEQKESGSEQNCLQMETTHENSEVVEKIKEAEQTVKESDNVQTCPMQVETRDENCEHNQVQENIQMEEEEDGVQTSPTQKESSREDHQQVEGQESEHLDKETGLAQAQPSQVETYNENHCHLNGEEGCPSRETGESTAQTGEKEIDVVVLDTDDSLQEFEGDSLVPADQTNGYSKDDKILESDTTNQHSESVKEAPAEKKLSTGSYLSKELL